MKLPPKWHPSRGPVLSVPGSAHEQGSSRARTAGKSPPPTLSTTKAVAAAGVGSSGSDQLPLFFWPAGSGHEKTSVPGQRWLRKYSNKSTLTKALARPNRLNSLLAKGMRIEWRVRGNEGWWGEKESSPAVAPRTDHAKRTRVLGMTEVGERGGHELNIDAGNQILRRFLRSGAGRTSRTSDTSTPTNRAVSPVASS